MNKIILKKITVLISDAFSVVFSFYLAIWLRYETIPNINKQFLVFAAINVVVLVSIFQITKVYKHILRANSIRPFNYLRNPLLIFSTLVFVVYTLLAIDGIPRSIGVIFPLLVSFLTYITRWLAVFIIRKKKPEAQNESTFIILGNNNESKSLIRYLVGNKICKVASVFDIKSEDSGRFFCGVPVKDIEGLENYLRNNKVDHVLISESAFSKSTRINLVNNLSKFHVIIKNLPSINDIVTGVRIDGKSVNLDIDELLGRESIPPDENLMKKNVDGKVILITGAGGSIGSEICRQLIRLNPEKLILVEQSEFALYTIHNELTHVTGLQIIPLLGSVTDVNFIDRVFDAYKPNTIFHAAAYKHVPMVEHNPISGIYNNVIGSYVVASAANRFHADNAVLISTDKAVRPTNIMGVSKRLSELVFQSFADLDPSCKFSMVRFGNVLGSSGSVVPKFKSQIENGGPITLTDPEIIRYFMSIPEAAQLVLQACGMANGGEVFVLDMGNPVKIIDLAKRMILLSGKSLENDEVQIKVTGLRPGEKLYEELLIGNNPTKTDHPKILMAHEDFIPMDILCKHIACLKRFCMEGSVVDLINYAVKLPVEYIGDAKNSDYISTQCVSKK